MKIIRFLGGLWFFIPCLVLGAGSSEFQNASNLLIAARRGDVQTVQSLVNSGVDVNYVDSNGLSVVCTAVMNNDTRAIQVLQSFGADASKCDKQIKQYRKKSSVAAKGEDYNFFSGLSSSHVIALSAVAVAGVIGGVALLTDAFDGSNGNSSNPSSGSHSGSGGGGSSGTTTTKLFSVNLPYGPLCKDGTCSDDFSLWQGDDVNYNDFDFMSDNGFNYLMVARAYNAFVRGYLGMSTLRIASDKSPFDLSTLPYVEDPSAPGTKIPVGGGKLLNVAMVTETGVNPVGSAVDGLITWVDAGKVTTVQSICQASGGDSEVCLNAFIAATGVSHKYYNYGSTGEENFSFNLTGSESVFGSSASDSDTKLAKIIAGWNYGERGTADYYGFIPNGQLLVYKIGTGESGVSDYKNYEAIYSALTLAETPNNYVTNVVVNLSSSAGADALSYANLNDIKILYEAASSVGNQKLATFWGLIDNYYDLNKNDGSTPSTYANSAFNFLGINKTQILVNSAGRSLWGLGDGKSLSPQVATFENFAPVLYSEPNKEIQNLFMTVVAANPVNGTDGETIAGYSAEAAGKIQLSQWTESGVDYSSRMCGLAGTGNGGQLNPWCFTAPGVTDLEATAAMAGSVALVKSAFDYMTPQQVYLLLALTADGPYLGTDPDTGLAWKSGSDDPDKNLREYLKKMYVLPGNLDSADDAYLESFKTAFGYGMINLERATRPGTNIYFYNTDTDTIVSSNGNAYWRSATTNTTSHASSVFSLAGRSAITTSYYDILESSDGSLSLPRVWSDTFALENSDKHGLYMGDVLGDFNVDSSNKRNSQIGNINIDMAMSVRAYNDNLNGLDNLHITFNTEKFDLDAQYQHYLTDGESRFNGRANGLLALTSNAVSSGATYKSGNFGFGGRAFFGSVTDESLLETDPTVSNQFEPGRLGFVNGAEFDAKYNGEKFGLNISVGTMHEDNTVLGSLSSGLLALDGADTKYIDAVAVYKPFENVKLSLRGTFADTHANVGAGLISDLSDIKSNAFAFGADIGGFEFTASMPLATVNGKMAYGYADFEVVENDGKYEIAVNNAHTEYINLAQPKRELRFATSYKKSVGQFTDAGVGFIYRINPNNTDVFGNESVMMFKIHHRLGL